MGARGCGVARREQGAEGAQRNAEERVHGHMVQGGAARRLCTGPRGGATSDRGIGTVQNGIKGRAEAGRQPCPPTKCRREWGWSTGGPSHVCGAAAGERQPGGNVGAMEASRCACAGQRWGKGRAQSGAFLVGFVCLGSGKTATAGPNAGAAARRRACLERAKWQAGVGEKKSTSFYGEMGWVGGWQRCMWQHALKLRGSHWAAARACSLGKSAGR